MKTNTNSVLNIKRKAVFSFNQIKNLALSTDPTTATITTIPTTSVLCTV
jgi:hypothetical protein